METTVSEQPPLPSSTLVHPPEINPENPFALGGGIAYNDHDLAQSFRHSGWRRVRGLVNAALKRTDQSMSRIQAFQSCGFYAYVYRSLDRPYRYRLGGSSCRDRFCLPCAKDRGRVLAANILEALADQPARFVTLTLKHNKRALSLYLIDLLNSFNRLRARTFWKSRVTGGAAFIEVVWSAKTHDWHAHLHVLVHGRFLPRRDLSREWYKVTGDSMVTDVRFVKDKRTVGRYVTKYVSKPFNNTFVNRPHLLDEAVIALRGKRLCATFGDWRGIALTASPSPDAWESLGSFHSIVCDARDGDPIALEALRAICPDNVQHAIQAVALARPPPPPPLPVSAQLIFQWNA